jgi:hypothetical protein
MANSLSKAWSTLIRQGPLALARKILSRFSAPDVAHGSVVSYDDATAVDWTKPHPAVTEPLAVSAGSLTVAWIMSPPGENSGGHQNIFRFIEYLERAGHHVRIYLHSVHQRHSIAQVRSMLQSSAAYPALEATIENLPESGLPAGIHAVFATSWETAYPAFLDRSPARRLYFVQDFEPFFYPVGTESVLAENTYRFGFTGITAGNWLASKLAEDYGMSTRFFDFSADRAAYRRLGSEPRREIFFYARPATARRGFGLGVMALDLFARARPEFRINFAGEDVSRQSIPFSYHNLGAMPVDRLNELYNRCAAGLVLSLTNMSLLPLELLSAGVIPVVNDAPNNTMVSANPYIEFAPPSPKALADRLVQIVDRTDLVEYSRLGAESVGERGWDESGAQFVRAVEEVVLG